MNSARPMENAHPSTAVQSVKDVDRSAVDRTKSVTKQPSNAQASLVAPVLPTAKTTTLPLKLRRLGVNLA